MLLHTGQDEKTPSQRSMPMSSSPLNETVFPPVRSSSSSKYRHSLDGTLTARGHFTLRQIQHALYGACAVLQRSRILFPIVSGSSEPGNDRKYTWERSPLLEFGPLPHPSMTVHHTRCLDSRSHNTTETFYNHCLSHCPEGLVIQET